MNDKEKENNTFKLGLYQENTLLCETIFDANNYNPFTRYSIDVRDILPKMISDLQKYMSKKKYYTKFDYTGIVDNYEYFNKIISSYPEEIRDDLDYKPKSVYNHIKNDDVDIVIKGIECKIGLYINNKTIVERLFYVDNYNSMCRWSIDLLYVFLQYGNMIEDKIKKLDVKNMWDDYDLINQGGLHITQIRELSINEREKMLTSLVK